MSTRVKKLMCLIVMFALTVTVLAACSGNKETPKETPAPTEQPAATTGTEPTPEPEKPVDLGGYEFTIVSPFIAGIIKSENSPQSPFLDAFDKRQKEIEQKYNCKIVGVNAYPNTTYLQPLIMSGEKVGDVLDMMPDMWVPASQAGYLTPWDDVKGVDVNADKWVKAYTNMAVLDGKHWGLSYNRPPEVRGCMFFNKTMLSNYNQPDLYELVKKGEWTFDKFREIAIACTKDSDNDGKNDTYGMNYLHKYNSVEYFVAANDGRLVKDESGKMVTNFSTQNVLDALQFVYDLYHTDKVVEINPKDAPESTTKDYPWDYSITRFMEGKTAFIVGDSWMADNSLKKMKDDFGIIPLPKGPAANDYTSLANNMRIFAVTSTNKDLDKTALIWNALTEPMEGFEGDLWWQEDMRDEIYRDDQSIEMYNMLLEKSFIDYGYQVTDLGFNFENVAIHDSVYMNIKSPAAALDSIKGMFQEQVDAIFNK